MAKQYLSYKDAAMRYNAVLQKYAARGRAAAEKRALAELQRLVRLGPLSIDTIRRAAEYLAKGEYGDASLAGHVEDTWPKAPRGQRLPRVGEERDYALQEQTGRQFFRIPGETLHIKKHQKARVRFEEDRIVIFKKQPRKKAA